MIQISRRIARSTSTLTGLFLLSGLGFATQACAGKSLPLEGEAGAAGTGSAGVSGGPATGGSAGSNTGGGGTTCSTGAAGAGGSSQGSGGGGGLGGAPNQGPTRDSGDLCVPEAPFPVHEFTGEKGGSLGDDATFVGDMDGDGFDELLIIDSSYPGTLDRLDSYQTQGIAYLFYGRAAVPATLSAAEADAMLVGVGPAVAKIGDISGDGYDDFAFTALCEFWPNCPATNGVHIAYGSAARLAGEHRSDEVGTTWSTGRNDSRYTWINGAGDVNGDGLSDFVVDVGTLNVGPEPWYTYLFLGRPNSAEQVAAGPAAVFEGMSGGHQVYAGSTGAGDVDGDGYDDLLISTLDWAEQTGTINLFYGGADRFEGSVLPGEADASFAWLSDAFGIGGFGDLDGDGFDDLFLTAQLSVGWRPVHVIYGREERFSGSYGLDAVEFSIEGSTNMSGLGAGDVNGDGALDVLLGDVDAYLDYGWGALFLQLGSGTRREGTLALTLDNVLLRGQTRDRRGDHMGSGVAANGDFNADGYDDVVVCAWGDDGRVFLILGQSL